MGGMRAGTIERFRRQLMAEQTAKLASAGRFAFGRRGEWCREPVSGDEGDHAAASADEHLAFLRLDRELGAARSIGAALRTMEGGCYGVCLVCEEPIPARRLRALPTAVLCRCCQERVEAEWTIGGA
jgi:DnaK suppressor protein